MDEIYITTTYIHGRMNQIHSAYRDIPTALMSLKEDILNLYDELADLGEISHVEAPELVGDSTCISISGTPITGCVERFTVV